MPERIAIVGNAPSNDDISSAVDQADRVVRFNNAFGYGGFTGTRIDDLYLINCGGQPLEWLRSDSFWTQECILQADRITLPFAAPGQRRNLVGSQEHTVSCVDGVNFEWDLRDRLKPLGRIVDTLPEETVAAAVHCLREFGASKDQINPSTGFLAIFACSQDFEMGTEINLYGFTFEGWAGHDWNAERAWVKSQCDRGRLVWHPC